MKSQIFNTLIVITAVATLVWMVWRKRHGKPYKVRWLLAVGLLLVPTFLTEWLTPPDWRDPLAMPRLIRILIYSPFLLGIAAFVGGLPVVLVEAFMVCLNFLATFNIPNEEEADD